MKIKSKFHEGYNAIVKYENSNMLMDYGILKMNSGTKYEEDKEFEKVVLLLYGNIRVSWEGKSLDVSRESFLDDEFWALNVPKDVNVTIEGLGEDSEIAIFKTPNEVSFESVVRTKENSVIETRGEGHMNGTGTRIVKTLMDKKLAPLSNFMFGEDVQYPGKWAGFPSHSHNQPEVYFYKLSPENGFGLVKLGDEGVLVEHNDTITINPDLVHPQVAAPGYAMYFLWIIRHLEGNPYLAPTFEEEHLWVEKPGAKYWPEI
jgi:5-deoxy-glucuronate isomerase